MQLQPRERTAAQTAASEEVLFVLAGAGRCTLNGAEHELEPESGAYLAARRGATSSRTPAPTRCGSSRVHDPGPGADPPSGRQRAVVRRLADQQAQAATTDREFRIVADPGTGLRSATHFVGYIPTARAPDHFHTYDEVIYVLDGEGVLHAGERTSRSARARASSCPPGRSTAWRTRART